MAQITRILLLPAALLLFGCKNVAPDADQPAVIINADDGSRAALQETVNSVLGKDVLLADNALTDSSMLIIEQRIPRSIEGSPAQGSIVDKPVQFRLVTDGSNCVLVDQRDGSRHLLANTSCVAE